VCVVVCVCVCVCACVLSVSLCTDCTHQMTAACDGNACVCLCVCVREKVSVYVSVSANACLCVPSVSLCADSRRKITAAGNGNGVLSFAEFKAAYLKGQVDNPNNQPATKLGARQRGAFSTRRTRILPTGLAISTRRTTILHLGQLGEACEVCRCCRASFICIRKCICTAKYN